MNFRVIKDAKCQHVKKCQHVSGLRFGQSMNLLELIKVKMIWAEVRDQQQKGLEILLQTATAITNSHSEHFTPLIKQRYLGVLVLKVEL